VGESLKTTVRVFIALSSPPEVKKVLTDIQNELNQEGGDVKWDTPDKFHITLKFLGDVEQEKLPALSATLMALSALHLSFELWYESLGAFPDLVHPRVLWAGARKNDSLSALHQSIDEACERFGFAREPRVFHPHITFGRVKGSRNVGRLTARLKSITFEPIRMHCSELLLIKSDLHPTGSIYATLNSFPFKA
jgi:2'-5' RNA ligase